jgi:hypothetical protein
MKKTFIGYTGKNWQKFCGYLPNYFGTLWHPLVLKRKIKGFKKIKISIEEI